MGRGSETNMFMLKDCDVCDGTGYEELHLEQDLIPITVPCVKCDGSGNVKIPSVNLVVTIYTKPLTRQLLSIEKTVNRPNNPEVHEIVEAWIKYNYGNIENYDYCEVDSYTFENIDANWNIENYL